MNDGIKTIATRRFNKKPGTKNDTHDLVDLILLADWAVAQLVTPSQSQIDLADVIESLEFAMQGRATDEAARGAIHGSVNVLKGMYGAVDGFPNLAAMREQMEELVAENRKLKTEMNATAKAIGKVVEWQTVDPEQEFGDGDQLLVAVPIVSRHKPNTNYWEYFVVRVSCDEGHFDMNTDEGNWGWSWGDVEFWMPLSEFRLPNILPKQVETTACDKPDSPGPWERIGFPIFVHRSVDQSGGRCLRYLALDDYGYSMFGNVKDLPSGKWRKFEREYAEEPILKGPHDQKETQT